MLLTENRQEILKERGYDAEYTPRYITERFLEQQVHKILTGRGEEKVENLVICVPEFWNTKAAADRRPDGRPLDSPEYLQQVRRSGAGCLRTGSRECVRCLAIS